MCRKWRKGQPVPGDQERSSICEFVSASAGRKTRNLAKIKKHEISVESPSKPKKIENVSTKEDIGELLESM